MTIQEPPAAHPDVVDALIALRRASDDYLGSAIVGIEQADETARLATAYEAAARVLRVQAGTRQIGEALSQ